MTNPRMAFLQDIIPAKIKAKEYFRILEQIEQGTYNRNDDYETIDDED